MTVDKALTYINRVAEQYRLGIITIKELREEVAITLIDLEYEVRHTTRESLRELATLN